MYKASLDRYKKKQNKKYVNAYFVQTEKPAFYEPEDRIGRICTNISNEKRMKGPLHPVKYRRPPAIYTVNTICPVAPGL